MRSIYARHILKMKTMSEKVQSRVPEATLARGSDLHSGRRRARKASMLDGRRRARKGFGEALSRACVMYFDFSVFEKL